VGSRQCEAGGGQSAVGKKEATWKIGDLRYLRFQISDFRLEISDFRLEISDFRLQI
jgi:hypothetical protein